MDHEQVNHWADKLASRAMSLGRKVANRLDYADAEECESLALERLMQLLQEYSGAPEHVWPWVYKALRNDIRDFIKKERRRVEFDGIESDHAIALENQDELQRNLTRLPEHLRAVVGLRLQGWDYKAIGERLGIALGSARVYFVEAMKIFQNSVNK